MAEEIEAKVKIADPEAFGRRMAAHGPPAAGPALEVNRLFDDGAGALRRAGSALRLREERPLTAGAPVRATLTFKGKRRKSCMKRRPEFETAVESAGQMTAILQALGLAEVFRYEKRRTTWHVGECEVVLDDVPYLGWFVEVEGPTEQAVLGCLADLGLADQPILKRSYICLLAEHLAAHGRDPTRAVF